MKPEGKRVKVVSITKSPVFDGAWWLNLSCGHVLHLRTTTKPERTDATCPHESHQKEQK